MDFTTIKNKMNAQDGSGYKNVREVYSDVRLIFKNAMKYNDECSDVYIMAKTMLEKFELKWLQLLPKVTEEVSCLRTVTFFSFSFFQIRVCASHVCVQLMFLSIIISFSFHVLIASFCFRDLNLSFKLHHLLVICFLGSL